ncbi:hypothetical protein ILYODFUR_016288 [Ilyodon furcidens]|uniref:Secreted protein n=1 Tax=Ilyodon furcidens TaxID=33524 RepID=A0ABV0USG3_9TELE
MKMYLYFVVLHFVYFLIWQLRIMMHNRGWMKVDILLQCASRWTVHCQPTVPFHALSNHIFSSVSGLQEVCRHVPVHAYTKGELLFKTGHFLSSDKNEDAFSFKNHSNENSFM